MKRCYLMLVVLLAVAVSAQANLVPNGDFQTIVKPGTTIAATIADETYFGIDQMAIKGPGGALVTYADGSEPGTGVELPGWIVPEGGKTNADVMQAGPWGGPDGSGDMAFLCFGSWGGPTMVTSAAPLSLPALGAGEVYTLSADVFNNGGPVRLDLLVDGVVIAPDAESTPALIAAEWVEFTRTYNSIPAGDVTILIGTDNSDGQGGTVPWTGNRASIDNVSLVVPEPATMALLALGGLLIRRKRA